MSKPLAEAPVTRLATAQRLAPNLPSLLAAEAERLGPIFRWPFPELGSEMTLLVGPEANRLVFHTQRETFSHDLGWTPAIGSMMGYGLLNQDNPAWQRSRKMWNPAFTTAYIETYLPLLQDIIAHHTAEWAAHGEVDLLLEAREITFHVAAAALAGVRRTEEIARMQRLFMAILPTGVPFAVRGPEAYAEYQRVAWAAKTELDAMLLALIAERRAAPPEASHDVLGLITHARDDEGTLLTDDEVLGHLYVLLVAGHETTTHLSAWALYLLATLPDHRQRVEAELHTLLGAYSAPLIVETARQLHVLDRFIRETGRLHSPVQMAPRGLLADVEFAGYTIPAGTNVRLALAACHRMERYFANPDAFDPDRFVPPREEDRATPYGLVTFGGGPRLCIGINFATIEVKALVADVLGRYTLTPVKSAPPQEFGAFLTIRQSGGMPMLVVPR